MALRTIFALLLAVMCIAPAAKAQELNFYSGPILSPSSQLYFVLDAEPTPSFIAADGLSFTFENTTVFVYDSLSGFFPTTDDITFYDASSGGGFSVGQGFIGSGIRYYGSQLFSGTTNAPLFAPATFTLTNDYFPSSSDFVISPADAVPETATWALLIIGFGGIGTVMRRSRGSSRAIA